MSVLAPPGDLRALLESFADDERGPGILVRDAICEAHPDLDPERLRDLLYELDPELLGGWEWGNLDHHERPDMRPSWRKR